MSELTDEIEWCRSKAQELRAKADELDAMANHWIEVTTAGAPTSPAPS